MVTLGSHCFPLEIKQDQKRQSTICSFCSHEALGIHSVTSLPIIILYWMQMCQPWLLAMRHSTSFQRHNQHMMATHFYINTNTYITCSVNQYVNVCKCIYVCMYIICIICVYRYGLLVCIFTCVYKYKYIYIHACLENFASYAYIMYVYT